MDLRPQGHDIIRTWLFSTVLRAHLEHGSLPWLHAALSGFVTDPDRKKMSKSKGNVVTPFALLEEHGSDGVRYWAAKGGPGVDTVFDRGPDEGWPAARDQGAERVEVHPCQCGADRADHRARSIARCCATWRTSSSRPRRRSTSYEYGRAIDLVEREFWGFCDDYLEFVKGRRYGEQGPEAPDRPTAR